MAERNEDREEISEVERQESSAERLAEMQSHQAEIAEIREQLEPIVQFAKEAYEQFVAADGHTDIDGLCAAVKAKCAEVDDREEKVLCRVLALMMYDGKPDAVAQEKFRKFAAKKILSITLGAFDEYLKNANDSLAVQAYHRAKEIAAFAFVRLERDATENLTIEEGDWRRGLMYEADEKTNQPCRVLQNQANALRALQLCPETQGLFRLNEISGLTEIHGTAPWEPEIPEEYVKVRVREDVRGLTDLDPKKAAIYFTEQWQLPPEDGALRIIFSNEAMENAMHAYADENRYDPAMDYYAGLEWDGEPRMETALNEVFSGDPDDYSRLASRVLFTSIAVRQIEPGCKSDIAIILEGDEGFLKSTFVSEIWPVPSLFREGLPALDDKDAMAGLRGVVVIEIPEMTAVSKTRYHNSVKEFFTKRVDTYRPAFGRQTVVVKRRVVFVITTNEEVGYLKDAKGNRRFLPFKCLRKADMRRWREIRDQVHAEAYAQVTAFRDGRGLENTGHPGQHWPTPAQETTARVERQSRIAVDEWEETVRELLHTDTGGRLRDEVVTRTFPKEMLGMVGVQPENQAKRTYQNRMARVLEKIGFRQDSGPLRKTSLTQSGTDLISARWYEATPEAIERLREEHNRRSAEAGGGSGTVVPLRRPEDDVL